MLGPIRSLRSQYEVCTMHDFLLKSVVTMTTHQHSI